MLQKKDVNIMSFAMLTGKPEVIGIFAEENVLLQILSLCKTKILAFYQIIMMEILVPNSQWFILLSLSTVLA